MPAPPNRCPASYTRLGPAISSRLPGDGQHRSAGSRYGRVSLATAVFGEVDRHPRYVQSLGRDVERLLAVGQRDVHCRAEGRALDRQSETVAAEAPGHIALGRVGLLLPGAAHLAALDAQFGQGVDGIVGAGAAHGLANLRTAVRLIKDAAFHALGLAVGEGNGAVAAPITREIPDRVRQSRPDRQAWR